MRVYNESLCGGKPEARAGFFAFFGITAAFRGERRCAIATARVQLSEETDKKLEILSRGTGHSKSYVLKEIIEQNIDALLEEHRLDALALEYEEGKGRVYTEAELDAEFLLQESK